MSGILGSVLLGASAPSVPPTSGASVSGPFVLGLDIIFEAFALVLGIGLLVGVVILVVANRADPDPTGRRPQSVYFFAVAFLTVLVSIVSSVVMVESLTSLMAPHGAPIGNEIARTEVIAGLLLMIDFTLARNHLRRGLELARSGEEGTTPSLRVGQSYAALMAFLMVLVLIVTIVLSAYLIFALAGPGVFGSFGGKAAAGHDLIVSAYATVVAIAVLRAHLRLVPPRLHIFGQTESLRGPSTASPA